MDFPVLLVPTVIAVAAFFLCYGLLAVVQEWRDPTRRGIDDFTDSRIGRPRWSRRFWTRLASLGERLLPVLGSERSRIEAKLYLAGLRQPNAAALFFMTKLLVVLVLPTGIWAAAQTMSEMSPAQLWSLVTIGLVVALIGPNWWLDRRVRSRQARLRNGFPDSLDMLVICVEAGLGLTAAIERVTGEIRSLHPELAAEFAAVNAEIRSGVDRATALQSLNDRTGLPEIRGLVSLLVQTMQLGTGIADSLRIYSAEFRDQRMQRAEEHAAKIGTKMIFPLVLCELPAFFLVAVGPAVLRINESFGV